MADSYTQILRNPEQYLVSNGITGIFNQVFYQYLIPAG